MQEPDFRYKDLTMEEKKNDGGPAFPSDHQMSVMTDGGKLKTFGHTGLSVRQYYAAHALQGLLAGTNMRLDIGPDEPNSNNRLARCVLAMADAMLEAEKDGV